MSGGQPYLYQSPARYSALDPYNGFNPKAVTQASYAPPPPPKPKQEGPFLNFNRHPDSYQVLPGPANIVPMNPRTKAWVKWTRWIQLAFRALQLIGAAGVLTCVIAIRGATDNIGLTIRLPPMFDFLFSLYGIYHLMRPAHGRPPASSASYHLFALVIDVGLAGLYAFTALLGHANYIAAPGTPGRWRTYFSTAYATNTTLVVCYLASIAVGSLHLASISIDLFLLLIFKKIADLPPDMNPLEDNLTSRRQTKHKYKNSSATDISEPCFIETPGSRMSEVSKRRSKAQDPLLQENQGNRMSFFQSRTDKDNSFSPHNPNTARLSRAHLADEMYQQSHSARTSKVNLRQGHDSLTPSSTPSRRMSAMPAASPTIPKRNSAASILSANDDAKSYSSKPINGELQNDNWFVLNQDEDQGCDPYNYGNAEEDKENAHVYRPRPNKKYEPLPRYEQDDPDFVQQPLRVNPPTPPPQPISPREPTLTSPAHLTLQKPSPVRSSPAAFRPVSPLSELDKARTQTMTSAVSAATSSSRYSDDDDETVLSSAQTATASTFSTAPKSRFYGDLAAAMRGVRQNGGTSPRPKSMVGSLHNAASEVSYAGSEQTSRSGGNRSSVRRNNASRHRPKSYIDSVSGTVIRKTRRADESEEVNPYGWQTTPQDSSPRVVSRSGADVMAAGSDMGLARTRRDVSGKVVEEGRGGSGWSAGLFQRKISGAA